MKISTDDIKAIKEDLHGFEKHFVDSEGVMSVAERATEPDTDSNEYNLSLPDEEGGDKNNLAHVFQDKGVRPNKKSKSKLRKRLESAHGPKEEDG